MKSKRRTAAQIAVETLKALRSGPVTRDEFAAITGLHKDVIAKWWGELLATGIAVPAPAAPRKYEGAPGRRSERITIAAAWRGEAV